MKTKKPYRSKASAAIHETCLLYTSDAADERSSVDLGGRRIINKKCCVDQDSRCGLVITHLNRGVRRGYSGRDGT